MYTPESRFGAVKRSLYVPGVEHDACGTGFVASLNGPSRSVLDMALDALVRLHHRGAVAADGRTGDGAGILAVLPRPFVARIWSEQGGPSAEEVAVGTLFLPTAEPPRRAAEDALEAALSAEGLTEVRWRPVPTDDSVLGDHARRTRPVIRQVLVAKPAGMAHLAFERALYAARRAFERQPAAAGSYVVSLSAETMVYKGLLLADDLPRFYLDLADPDFVTDAVLFHQRFSTNTEPTWPRAQPYRRLAHNGEINTLQGNINWMAARLPGVLDLSTSDSGMLDNAAEHLHLEGRDLCHVMAMLIPEAWEEVPDLDEGRRAFYHYHACLTEPWDGPAAVVFADGETIGAILDRNGLRPMRYTVTGDGLVVAGSEAGIADIDPTRVRQYGKLGPGEMIAVDLRRGAVLGANAVKARLAGRAPYGTWLRQELLHLEELPLGDWEPVHYDDADLLQREVAFAYSSEEVAAVLRPMVAHGKPPNGSMGDDTPLAIFSTKERPLFHYFKQRFAEVTNPPIDHLRESFVFSLRVRLGPHPDIRTEGPHHAHLVEMPTPLLLDRELAVLRQLGERDGTFRAATLPTLFPRRDGPQGLRPALDRLAEAAEEAVRSGHGLLILSDRGVDAENVPMPSLLAVATVHHHLIRRGLRMRVGLIVESGEPREVHHVAALLGYGANAVNPYLVLARIAEMAEKGRVRGGLGVAEAQENYRHALEDGLKKAMSRMGISTVEGYTGAQIFEAVGLADEVIAHSFPGTPSRVGGKTYEDLGALMLGWHARAYPEVRDKVPLTGFYAFRKGGELHEFSPDLVDAMHRAVSAEDAEERRRHFESYRRIAEEAPPSQLRHLLALQPDRPPVPLAEVEPATSIVRRFSTGSMSLGSLSPEAHVTLAIAMNRLGARSGSGEGGEDAERFGDLRNSAIKQVASGRFGVTPAYLASAVELQIKMAQGSKPGEGGQIPGHKVTAYVARLRHTSPGVSLISPPPHHDIYSIEDLAQLIYDLKQANPNAEVSVKLVAETGVGIIAAGVAKGYADIIQISGASGGTGSSPLDSIKNAGLPWEIGLAETQQVLRASGLRDRVRLRVDGGLRTGWDVVVAALLGADEYSFGTAAMVAEGCTMMRICHTDNCPTGVATQREDLRRKFVGTPERVEAFFLLLAEEVREHLAALGYRSLAEVIGRVDLLTQRVSGHPFGDRLDLSPLLAVPAGYEHLARAHAGQPNRLPPEVRLDEELLDAVRPVLEGGGSITLERTIRNSDRTVGARLFHAIAKRHGDAGLPEGSIRVTFHGTAGQSFGAFMTPGVSFTLIGQANDYLGKGMAGGEIVLRPHPDLPGPSHRHTLLGNTALYGATGGLLLAAGRAGERFAVRNSGAVAVVEGVGDHGCEYMTMGTVVVLGPTGRNFGAGMTGGEAFVLDLDGLFHRRFNPQLIHTTPILAEDEERLLALLRLFQSRTGSERAATILREWAYWRLRFLRLAPKTEVRELASADEGSIA